MGVREVLIHRYGLTGCGNLGGKLDLVRQGGCTGTWGYFSVIVDRTESWLVIGEGRSVRIRSRSAVDDVGGVAVERVGGRVEGVEEVLSFIRLGGI